MTDMNYFAFMDESKHTQEYMGRKKAAQKARVAREVFKLGVNRIRDIIRAKKS